MGYLTGFTEVDPIRNAASGDYVLNASTGDRNTASSWVSTNSGNATYFRSNSGNYCLLSGNQTITGTIIIPVLKDANNVAYVT
jgi:hypothetical protein